MTPGLPLLLEILLRLLIRLQLLQRRQKSAINHQIKIEKVRKILLLYDLLGHVLLN